MQSPGKQRREKGREDGAGPVTSGMDGIASPSVIAPCQTRPARAQQRRPITSFILSLPRPCSLPRKPRPHLYTA